MKLSEIIASVKELKETVASFIGDKAKATTEALTGFSSKLTALETGAVAELGQKTADLLTAQQTIGTLTTNLEKAQAEVNTLGGSLKTACTALKLEVKADATSGEMITALQAGVSSTLAKLNVDPAKVPAGKAAITPGSPEATKKTRAEFSALSPVARMNFIKGGGRLTD